MAEILHEATGLKIHRNDKNGFVVVTLHHTADPSKRSAEWRREAELGMSKAKAARELDIDYGAMFGERVFPEFTLHKDKILVREPYPTFPSDQRYWGGFDYGMRNPSAFIVYTIWDGVMYAVWELYEPCKNIKEFALKMLNCPYYEKIRYIAADPHIADLRHYGIDGNGASIQDQFAQQGVKKLFSQTSNDEAPWLAMVRKHWLNPEDPTFRVFDCCPNLINEFDKAVYASQREAFQSKNYKEAIADVNNHAMDACKYFMLSMPQKQHQQATPKYGTIWKKWKV